MRIRTFLLAMLLLAPLTACEKKAKPEKPTEPDKQAEPGKSRPAPADTGWQVSADQKTWEPVELPSVAWKCDRCDRFFRTAIQGIPRSVKFRFASDNQARMKVNGTEVFAEFWKERFCTDAPCCGKCCDAVATCKRIVASGKTYELTAEALKAFKDGANEVIWEVHQDTGGSGFHVEMDVSR